jgi:hypothetical protein
MRIDHFDVKAHIRLNARSQFSSKIQQKVSCPLITVFDDSLDRTAELLFVYEQGTNKYRGSIYLGCKVDSSSEITIYLLHASESGTGIGTAIVKRLFECFPFTDFLIFAKRESVPFWFKMGFRHPEDDINEM